MAENVVTHPCARCGTAVPEAARFCQSCGAAQQEAPREERRVVTVLFGDLSGFTELSEARDAEEVKAIIDRAFERITDIVERYGGHVDKIIGDEVMAVFGAPQAHEDDAERAVRAALVIQRALQEDSAELERERGIPLRMHIGLNTGEVVAGFVGGSDSYTVLGDVVNTARRIGDAAEAAQILVGEATQEATHEAIEYRRIGQVTAKGKRLPVQVWEALAELGLPGERTVRAAPLIGREEELGVLDSLARIVRRDRRTMAATIVGEAGMGKSRLADEFARRVSAQGVRVLNGRSLPYGTASPAFSIEEMVRAALVVDPALAPDEAAAWVRDRLEAHSLVAEADRLLAFLGLGGTIPSRDGAPGSAQTTSQPTTSPLLESAMAVLERIAEAEGMLVLAFHELHWAEDAVLDFIQKMLGASRAPLMIVCLSRLELLERRPDWSVGLGSATIPMGPLPREGALEMLDALAPALPRSLRESVVERAGGNPFYLEELARLLVARGPETSSAPVPGSIQSLVAARLDALPAASKRLLQAPEVRELFERSEAALLPGQTGYRFRQALVRDVAYNSVPKNGRAQQHAAVGAWLEGVCADAGKEREFYDLIAHHYERAAQLARDVGGADPEAEKKARAYLELAGDQSHDMDAAQTAAGFYERALAFAGDDADRAALRIRLAEALVGSWQHEAAQDHLEEALVDARRLGDRGAEGKALRLRGDSLRMRGDAERARGPLEQALKIAKEIGDEREEAEGLRSHGLLDMFLGHWSASQLWFRQALARYRDLQDRRGEGWSLQNLGWAAMLMGHLDDAYDYLTEGESVFIELGDDEGSGWCKGMRAWVLLLRGEVMEAGVLAEELEHHLTVEHPEYLLNAGFALELMRILRAYVEVARGNLTTAETIARGTLGTDGSRFANMAWVQAIGRYPLFVAALLRCDIAAARAHVEDGTRWAESFGDPFYLGQFRFARSLLAFEEGNVDEAEWSLNEMLGAGELGRIWDGSAGVRWLEASIMRARGRLAEARRMLEEKLGRQNVGLVSTARSRALLAEIQLEQGDAAAAADTATTAVSESGEELIARVLALRILANALVQAGKAADAEATTREELSLLDGADWDVERIRALGVLAKTLDAQRRHDEASEALDRARALLAEQPAGTDPSVLESSLLG
ncbi:MAG TPA: adenylate/guanylate cyclase domain-containing protein [Actinomycetota bacterium]|nr:adenylate/guanylate cyclase domain-containing protein [Actinomycetota bacterium]